MIADYWRYLAIWEYGGTPNYLKNFVATTMKLTDLLLTGIYTDMDNAPGSSFNNGTVIADEYDAFFEVERDGFPSQYFFAGKFFNGVFHKENIQLLTVLSNYYPSLAAPSCQLLHGGNHNRKTNLHGKEHSQN
jgi:hypothetical protein